jgi:hypothetical protein
MNALVIEKNIPIPTRIRGSVYPFKEMEIGDSFLASFNEKDNVYKQKQKIYLAIWRFSKNNPDKKFVTQSLKQALRVWRIK